MRAVHKSSVLLGEIRLVFEPVTNSLVVPVKTEGSLVALIKSSKFIFSPGVAPMRGIIWFCLSACDSATSEKKGVLLCMPLSPRLLSLHHLFRHYPDTALLSLPGKRERKGRERERHGEKGERWEREREKEKERERESERQREREGPRRRTIRKGGGRTGERRRRWRDSRTRPMGGEEQGLVGPVQCKRC